MRIFLRENFEIDVNDSIEFILIYELKWSYIFRDGLNLVEVRGYNARYLI